MSVLCKEGSGVSSPVFAKHGRLFNAFYDAPQAFFLTLFTYIWASTPEMIVNRRYEFKLSSIP